MSDLLKVLKEDNICTHYILPLIALNKFAFGSNFLNCYVDHAGTRVIVEVIDSNLCASLMEHPRFITVESGEASEFLYYELQSQWQDDFEKFVEGKYSRLSDRAKQCIMEYSGLKWESPKPADQSGKVERISDARLVALYRGETLRDRWAAELGVHSLSDDDELLPKPSPQCFLEL